MTTTPEPSVPEPVPMPEPTGPEVPDPVDTPPPDANAHAESAG